MDRLLPRGLPHLRIVARSLEGSSDRLEALCRAAYWFAVATFVLFRLTAWPAVATPRSQGLDD